MKKYTIIFIIFAVLACIFFMLLIFNDSFREMMKNAIIWIVDFTAQTPRHTGPRVPYPYPFFK